ncbi:SIS domain-containing protein [Pantoea sp.]|uniref:SIS domain-containing protein n=1 Tax=Pantoea sp. TaxID=69393 RepID=UPI00289926F0|nr:SIS domain-containing protein [Pantoea sp.]
MTTLSAYEKDILQQPDALSEQLNYALPAELYELELQSYDRIVLAGMGSSDYALIPIERALIARGLPVWRIDAGRLLDMPKMVTPDTLLWMTSQSGMSGEVVKLLDVIVRPRTLIGVTNDTGSILARRADILMELRSGDEATVSAKSYLNTLVASYRVLAALTGESEQPLLDRLHQHADLVAARVQPLPLPQTIADDFFRRAKPRLVMVGMGADAATAMTGALITKESSKVSAEGFIGGEFRHGPMETSGAEMTALLFGDGSEPTLIQLATDLQANGTRVISVAPTAYADSELLETPQDELMRLIIAMLYVQQLTVTLARGNGMVPGQFLYGQKITVTL